MSTPTIKNVYDEVYAVAGYISFGCSAYLALTSGVWVYRNVNGITRGLPVYMEVITMIAAVLLCLLMIDFKNGKLIDILVQNKASNQNHKGIKKDASRNISIVLVVLLLLRLGLSFGLTYNVTPDIGEYIAGEDHTKFYIEQYTDQANKNHSEKEIINERIKQLSKTEKQRIKSAEAKGKEIINDSIYKSTYADKWRVESYYNEGIDKRTAWLVNSKNPDLKDSLYADAIFKARSIANQLVQKELDKTNSITSNAVPDSLDGKLAKLIDIADRTQLEFIGKKERKTNSLYLVDFFAILILVLSSLIKSWSKMMGAETKRFKVNILSPTLSGVKGFFRQFSMFPSKGTERQTSVSGTEDGDGTRRRRIGFGTEGTGRQELNRDANSDASETAERDGNSSRHEDGRTGRRDGETGRQETAKTESIMDEERLCVFCENPIDSKKKDTAKYCSVKCRKEAYKVRVKE